MHEIRPRDAASIAYQHYVADTAQLRSDERLSSGGPVAYRTGATSVAEDLSQIGPYTDGDEYVGDWERAIVDHHDRLAEQWSGRPPAEGWLV